jgi:U3 small nucleolar RNA-associated protein 12
VLSLSLDEGVTAVALSADGRLVAAALLDSTVKVFFVDTLKVFLSLYGHKLPVTSLDISSDSTLIVTGSADRNMKIWGLDFGDCHKSIFCHDDTVTGVRWLPDTHRIVTSGKDGEVKMWDGDTFVRIQTLSPGHVGEIWGVAIAPNGRWVVSCGKDRSVRLWEKTGEVLVLDDERETEREEMAEGDVGERAAVPGEGVVALPTRRTAGTERGAESLMEALELYKDHIKGEEQQLPPLMIAFGAENPLDYMVGAVARIKSAELEEVLLVLPLDVVQDLVEV